MNIGKYVELYSEDLRLKNYAESSIENYCSQVALFLKDHESVATKPSEISERQIKEWLLKANTINSRKHRLSAVKLFYKLTGKQPLKFRHIEYPKSDKKLPIVLSPEEVQRMFDCCTNLKHRAIFSLLYACGLRVSEVINLKITHIDSSRMVINIIQAKGKKDRQVMLPESLLKLLREYFKQYRPDEYLFNGQNSKQYSSRSINEFLKQVAVKAKVDNKRIYAHLIRHCTFTHMLENGVDLTLIQKVAGHSSIKTTQGYTHISNSLISRTFSPFSQIRI